MACVYHYRPAVSVQKTLWRRRRRRLPWPQSAPRRSQKVPVVRAARDITYAAAIGRVVFAPPPTTAAVVALLFMYVPIYPYIHICVLYIYIYREIPIYDRRWPSDNIVDLSRVIWYYVDFSLFLPSVSSSDQQQYRRIEFGLSKFPESIKIKRSLHGFNSQLL